MPKWLVVARREFFTRVRTWWFVVVTLLGPIGMAALVVVPALVSRAADKQIKMELVDHTRDQLGPRIAATIEARDDRFVVIPVPGDTREEELLAHIRDEVIDGYLVLPEDLLDGGDASYRGANATNFRAMIDIQLALQTAVFAERFANAGIDPGQLPALLRPVGLDKHHDTGTGEASSGEASFIVGYVVMFILYMSILLYAINVMRSVVQEKTSRVIEIVVSAVRPRALMLGKVLGVGSVGLFQLSIWVCVGAVLIWQRDAVLGLFGVQDAGGFEIPAISGQAVIVVLLYFLLGYFFYAAFYAAIGAMVNSEQEAQQAQMPIVILLVVPVVFVQLVADDPRGGAAEVLTLIPFASPILMPMRFLLGGADLGDVALSLGILIASMAIVIWLAARIYRVGILMYGKRPSLRDLVRWIRYD